MSSHRHYLVSPRNLVAAVLAFGCWLALSQPLQARTLLDEQMHKLAARIKNCLDQNGEKSISLGPIQPPPSFAANPGPGLVKLLGDELKRLGVETKYNAKLGIIGEIIPNAEDLKKITSVKVLLKMVNRINQPQSEVSIALEEKDDIDRVLGVNTAQPKENQFADDLYAVEVLVNRKPRPGTIKDDLPFVPLEKGEEYTLRLYNNADHEVSVWVGIDGLSIFAFNQDPEPDGKPRDYKVVIGPRSTYEVKGWYFNPKVTKGFLVTDYPQSAAALKNVTSGAGMIQAVFRACWEEGKPLPAGEVRDRGLWTGPGKVREEAWQTTKRIHGRVRATITIRYTKD